MIVLIARATGPLAGRRGIDCARSAADPAQHGRNYYNQVTIT